MAIYNPNFYNRFTAMTSDQEEAKRRTDGRWLLSFLKALEHTERTGGVLVQVASLWHNSNLRGPVAPRSM